MDLQQRESNAWKMWIVGGMSAAALLATGCSGAPEAEAVSPPGEVTQAENGGEASVADVDECSLLTDEEVSAVVGKDVTGTPANPGCGWREEGAKFVSALALTVNPGEGDIDWDATALGEVQGQEFEDVEGLGDEAKQSDSWLLLNAKGYYIQLHVFDGAAGQRSALTELARNVIDRL